ncbi:uncharacterized protein CIMG_11467 [Coccidioides immitis RS]|uniref:Inhibitor I9 domain-containing protein n=7 Tax=Coccidioides TaxID=5500 RepID=A0A0D8JVB5_COCIM|nr:hypothetical protein CPC735_068390 [Coccidioides posadasii C735 delta SOWgp]XP_012213889.1 uncharacterized protein CIMG_11467 [Coccidioides immitis RS]EFW14910.1 hypothetical protein CPSG_08568 [Coccidioides posadasii str. Silveira]KMM70578.1 hypothetical protein CPAG_06889 [Coccidioides posadasii RMSCC 3488]KMP05251.1 hypothetical protein CIRG_04932 [Coccidioides immitis RMSCC 2394]KMU77781.1 hypothetical protein CISG_01537 [Coccidioides immitis RMSCC 3703]KMU85710.1 hypothetical protein |eukprot:XP_003071302.1 hypothetical protein CPC735_068390 [Coccidioides posadasii C735 delta SOWgp]
MVMFNVTLKPNASAEELEKAKEEAKKTGGTIRHEYKLIKGFTLEYPDDHVHFLQSSQYVNVEQDGPAKTQTKTT